MSNIIYTRSPAVRLANYKAEAEKHNEKRATTGPQYHAVTWRNVRKWSSPYFLAKSSFTRSKENSKFYVYDLDAFGENVGDASDITRLAHTGWYTDSFQDGTLKGAVIAIRNHNVTDEDGAHRQYMPATYHSDWDCATVYNEFYDNKHDAAISADEYAERAAEICREYDAKFQAEQQVEELKEELHDINKKTLALIADVKKQADIFPKTVCSLIRDEIAEAVESRTEIFEKIASLEDNYWLAVE